MPTPYIAKTYIGVETGRKKDGSIAKQRVQALIISELGIYRLVMRSNKPEAEAFQDWVFGIIKSIREALGYEQYRAEDDEQCVLTTAQLGKLETKKSLVSSSHGGARRLQFINEHGIYTLIFRSNKPEAKAFRKWVTSLLKSLREALGYE